MQITSHTLFHLLSQVYQLHIIANSDNGSVIGIPKLLKKRGPFAALSGECYICAGLPTQFVDDAENVVFLICGQPLPLLCPSSGAFVFIPGADTPEDVMYVVCGLIRELEQWDGTLKEISGKGSDLQELLLAGHRYFPYPTGISDRNYIVTAYTPDCSETGIFDGYQKIDHIRLKTPVSVINDHRLDPDFASTLLCRESFVYQHEQSFWLLCMNIFWKDRFIARILAVFSEYPSPGQKHLFSHICGYLKEVFLNYTDDILVKKQNDKIHRVLSELLRNDRQVDEKELETVLDAYGWKTKQQFEVCVLRFENAARMEHIALNLCGQLELEWPQTYGLVWGGDIVWVINTFFCPASIDGHSRHQALSYILREWVCKAGISDEFSDLSELPFHYRQAVFALQIGSERKPHFWYFYFRNFAAEYMINLFLEKADFSHLYHGGIRKLKQYDEQSGTNYLSTLHAYLSKNQNATAAAEKLFMHRSTFIRQMKKITQITGIHWDQENSLKEQVHIFMTLIVLLEGKKTEK